MHVVKKLIFQEIRFSNSVVLTGIGLRSVKWAAVSTGINGRDIISYTCS
jgi:hypothetical protein